MPETYPYDPKTGKRLMHSGFPVNPLEPMTQKQVDYQYKLVANCSEFTEEDELKEVQESNQ